MEELLQRNVNMINVGTLEHLTPLHFASGSDKGLPAVEFLSRFTPSHGQHLLAVNAKDKWKRTALHVAVKARRSLVVPELLRMGADPTARDADMRTPFHYAVMSGDYKSMEILLQIPAVVVDVIDIHGWTSLHYSAYLGRSGVVSFLLNQSNKKSNCDIKDIEGRTPHSLACKSGCFEALKSLVLTNFVNDVDNLNRNLLHYTCSCESPSSAFQCLEFLMDFSTDLNNESDAKLDRSANDSLMNGSLGNKSSFFDVNLQDCDGRTPLMLASEFDSTGDLVDLLITNAAKVDIVDKEGIVAINYASAAGNVKALKILLETHYWNDTVFSKCPAQCASRYGHPECLELLLHYGIYDNLSKCFELSRMESSSGCFEVLESFINTLDEESLMKEDESIAEYTQYFTANESFHQRYLEDPGCQANIGETVTDLSKISLDDEHVRLFSEEGSPSPEMMSPLPSLPLKSLLERPVTSPLLSNGCHLKNESQVNGLTNRLSDRGLVNGKTSRETTQSKTEGI